MNQETPLPITEQRNPLTVELDAMTSLDLVRVMNRQDATVPLAIAEVLPAIARAVDGIVAAFQVGGRLFYQGAGTSGRLGVLDATELAPTFSVDSELTVALMAGGEVALTTSVEGAEDSAIQGKQDLVARNFAQQDVLVGLAASGHTPYVLGGLEYASGLGALTVALVCNPGTPMAAAACIPIEVVTGPEILTGSTRLKAGTAQKLVLNMLSTATMVRLGKAYSNLMVDVQPANGKLRRRAVRIVMEATGLETETAQWLLEQANWTVKVAVVMGLADINAEEARRRLVAAGGRVREAMGR